MTVEQIIEAALFGRVRDLAIFAAGAKAWPNVAFTPPNGPYLSVGHLPNRNERIFLKGSDPHLYRGILQLTVAAPLNAGPAAATALAGQVAESFPADLVLYDYGLKVRISRAPDVASPLREDARWMVPVSISYESFTAPLLVVYLDFSAPKNSQYVALI